MGDEVWYVYTIHEPSSIRRNVTFSDGEVHVCQNLHHFQEKPLLVHAIHLYYCAIFHPFIVDAYLTTAEINYREITYDQEVLYVNAISDQIN